MSSSLVTMYELLLASWKIYLHKGRVMECADNVLDALEWNGGDSKPDVERIHELIAVVLGWQRRHVVVGSITDLFNFSILKVRLARRLTALGARWKGAMYMVMDDRPGVDRTSTPLSLSTFVPSPLVFCTQKPLLLPLACLS